MLGVYYRFTDNESFTDMKAFIALAVLIVAGNYLFQLGSRIMIFNSFSQR